MKEFFIKWVRQHRGFENLKPFMYLFLKKQEPCLFMSYKQCQWLQDKTCDFWYVCNIDTP